MTAAPQTSEPIFAGKPAELWLSDTGEPIVYVNQPRDRGDDAFTALEAHELTIELASVAAHVGLMRNLS